MTAEPPGAAPAPAPPGELALFLLAGQRGAAAGAPDARTALTDAVGYAVAAEAAGFDGVWLAEHHFIRYGSCPSATLLAAHLLAATRHLWVGTAACVLSDRHPVALGEEAALLDALAPGRFRLGVARGGPWVDLEVFGTGPQRFTDGFPESLDLLLRWVSGAERVGARGRFFDFREVAVVPRPCAALPVWVAATSGSTVDLAAARGLPLLLGVQDTAAAKAAMLHRYATTATAHGHDPDAVPHVSAHVATVGDTDGAARAAARATLADWLATTADYVRVDGPPSGRDLAAYREHLLDIHPVGAVDSCVRRLHDTAATTGVRRFMLMVEASGDRTATLSTISALGAALRPSGRRDRRSSGGPDRVAGA